MRPDWHDFFSLPSDDSPAPCRKRPVREDETPRVSPIRITAEAVEPEAPEPVAVHEQFAELSRLKRLLHSRRPRHLGTI